MNARFKVVIVRSMSPMRLAGLIVVCCARRYVAGLPVKAIPSSTRGKVSVSKLLSRTAPESDTFKLRVLMGMTIALVG